MIDQTLHFGQLCKIRAGLHPHFQEYEGLDVYLIAYHARHDEYELHEDAKDGIIFKLNRKYFEPVNCNKIETVNIADGWGKV